MSKLQLLVVTAVTLAGIVEAPPAEACGGFFCGRQPVDQTAERILFEVAEDSVTMTTQIAYNGAAEDFAWVLPLAAVPDPDSLAVFSQRALTALDAGTGPVFDQPCFAPEAGSDGGAAGGDGGGGVTVHVRAEVGDYDVAVIESSDPAALIEWLRAEDYRVTEPMQPYIELYTSEGMKFLALKLLETADVKDLKPFRFTLPGNVASIPLRMTSLAAEPEMSLVVFILGDQRYEAKNWENVTIDDSELRVAPYSWPALTNWTALVAKGVDAAGGQGWVTEFAGSTLPFVEQIQGQIDGGFFPEEEDREAAESLLEVLEGYPYLTRFYSRLSAEEMTSDPIFGRSSGPDVDRFREIQQVVDGVDVCSNDTPVNPCDFVTCGAGGVCRTALVDDGAGGERTVVGCGCLPGATARTTFAPDGSATVICQDQRMSFLNAGDQEAGMETLPDACAEFDCGQHGTCVAVNMTPTCVCDQGYVAVGDFSEDGQRSTECVEPSEVIDPTFYDGSLPELPDDLPGGRDVMVLPDGSAGEASSVTTSTSTSGGTTSASGGTTNTDGTGPQSATSGSADDAGSDDAGCSCRLSSPRQEPAPVAWLGLLALGAGLVRRWRAPR